MLHSVKQYNNRLYAKKTIYYYIEAIVMENTYFTHNEAQQLVGRNVVALFDFPSVPSGSIGAVKNVKLFNDKNWIVRVKWNIPRKSSLILSQLGEFSFNFIKRSKVVTDDFSKSDYYKLLKEK